MCRAITVSANPSSNGSLSTVATTSEVEIGEFPEATKDGIVSPLAKASTPIADGIVLFAPQAQDSARCVPKITVKTKGLVRCDDGASQTCNEFCAKQGGKCVDTCEDKILVDQGNEVGAKEMMVKAGMFEVQVYDLKIHPKVSGSCNQDYSPSFGPGTKLPEVCRYNAEFVPRCCCDVK